MKNIIITGALLFLSASLYAQNPVIKRANLLYSQVSYAQAADIYEDLLGTKHEEDYMKSNLADCYYQIGNTEQAEKYYSEIVADGREISNIELYQYAQSLKENGKTTESDQMMKQYVNRNAAEIRSKVYSGQSEGTAKLPVINKVSLLTANSSASDFGGYPKGNEVYFISSKRTRVANPTNWGGDNETFLDIYKSDRNEDNQVSNDQIFSRKVNTSFHEGPICFSKDGKTVYFTRNNIAKGKARKDDKGIQNLMIQIADINEDGEWENIRDFPLNSRQYSVGHPTLNEDETKLYFVSDMPGGIGGSDIYEIELNNGTFGNHKNLGNSINTEGQEMFPWFYENTLFFASDGRKGLGGLDIYMTSPENVAVKNIGAPFNSQKDDFALTWIDGFNGYFSSNRSGGNGDDDIYTFNLSEEFKSISTIQLDGVISSLRTDEILPGATVNLLDESGSIIASTVADENGVYTFDLEPGKDYSVEARMDEYFLKNEKVTTKDLAEGTETLNQPLELEKDLGLALYVLIRDAKSMEALEGVGMRITDNLTGTEFGNILTPESGDFLKELENRKKGDKISYNIALAKEGYFPKTVIFEYTIEELGVINVHELLRDLTMDKVVGDLSDMVEINAINFDLNKSNIRPDAQKELDKIVEVMNKYPDMEVELGSHTDCRASVQYNQRLSNRRAISSANYIKSRIVNPDRIYGKGYGESRLLNDCGCEGAVVSDCTEEEHEQNRRTEFKVISVGGENVKITNNSPDSFQK